MREVGFPLKLRMRRPQVGDLQDRLKKLLDGGALVAPGDEARRELSGALENERARSFFGSATRQLVSTLQKQVGLPDSGEFDQPTAKALEALLGEHGGSASGSTIQPSRYQVEGVVRLADGFPASGVAVIAVDRDLRNEQQLGAATAGRDGAYRIEFSERDFLDRESGSADVVVRALGADGALLATSAVSFNAPSELRIDLTIPFDRRAPATLLDRLVSAVTPLLGDLRINELEENSDHDDLTFLAGETGFDKPVLARLALTHRLAAIGIEPEFWFALLGLSAFAYSESETVQENLGRISGGLPSLDAGAVRKALGRSFAGREIDEALQSKVPGWVDEFLQLLARRSLDTAGAPSFAGQALAHAGIGEAKKQQKFAALFHQYKAFTPDLIAALNKERSFKKAEIADLATSYRLAELTRSDFSVVGMLKDEFSIRRPDQVWLLAKLSEGDWVTLIETKQTNATINIPLDFSDSAGLVELPLSELYAKTLARRFGDEFPTGAFAGGLQRALQNGGSRGLAFARQLSLFLDRNTDFELLCTPIDHYLKADVRSGTRRLATNDDFVRELKSVQRVFKLTRSFEATDVLLADGMHSAQLVYRAGESQIVRRYGNLAGSSVEGARLIWRRAADTHAAALTIVGDLQALRIGQLPAVLQNGTAALSSFPNWDNLFQAGDLCACGECRSVIGPAAYFADLLMFLKDRSAANPAFTVKDILFRRRADLGYLELDCENATTELPYIDLVCEVLESVVAAGENDVELVGFGLMPAGSAAARAAVTAALKAVGIDPGTDYSLIQVDPANPDRWVVHSDAVTYLLKKKTTPSFFAQVLPNTKAETEELQAYPAYVDPKAYNKLRQARSPFALPFDLFAEEIRAGFQKCNLQRWDLMRTLRGPAAPNNPTDGDIAAEYFGISSDPAAAFDEKGLMLVSDPTPAGQQVVWGEAGNAGWLNTVANVKVFLAKTRLEYEDLLALIDLEFVNPGGVIFIEHLDASCDTDQKIVHGLTPARLDRIHRFLRMWRKLAGWKMWELDLVVRCAAIGGGALDEPFLINLYSLGRIRDRLGAKATVDQVCGLLDHLNTGSQFTELYKKRADGLYQRLFLNKRLIQPLDPAFEVTNVNLPGPTAEKISGHRPVILAALGVREADLDVLAGLTRASNGANYITNDLTLDNLSFLWRHAWLAKAFKLKIDDWKIVLKLLQQDVATFANPKAAFEFIETVDHLTATGFKPDELAWLLSADRAAQAAIKEADASRFLAGLRTDTVAIHAEYHPAQYDYLDPPSDIDRLTSLLTTLLQQLNRDEPSAQFFIRTLRDEVEMQVGAGLPAGFGFPPAIKNAIRIHYDGPATTLHFTGLMTAAQRTTLLTDATLAAVTGIAAYQQAIDEFYGRPRLALKFFNPVFTAPLATLPAAVDFTALPDPGLAARVSYEQDQRVLQVVGALSADEKVALDNLSADGLYRNAVGTLFTEPALGVFPPESIWLVDADLQFPLRDLTDPTNDKLSSNLATAVKKALAHLAKTSAESLVVQRASSQLGLTEGLTRRLLTEYNLLPGTLLAHFTGTFATTLGVVDYATLKPTFDGWYWANRVALPWKKWKLTIAEWERIHGLTAQAKLLDFGALPLDDAAAMAQVGLFLRTSRLVRFKDSLPESETTLLEVLKNLNGGTYAAPSDFAADIERLNSEWSRADVEALVASLDLAYPNDYLLAENWERLRRAFYFLYSLSAGADSVAAFAAAAMTATSAETLKELLRSSLGVEGWLPMSTEIQNALREHKRDALIAYLLALPKPADAPTGKWENTDDLYAYYLLDVEMSSCQLTSRLVQASGSVQLFVQRCFMGLEPDVTVQADGTTGDSAWKWWTWMRKYRVWQANREVFLWPENWIEPELKKDRSSFMKDLESELQQNEINGDSVETAFMHYLDKLNGVAQLEPAGFYQEDDGDTTIIHVFGRTKGTDPPSYYYRRYDYRQWTPWEKVDLDIKGDYLIPAVIGNRLFLFWPVFIEVPDEANNSNVSTPRLQIADQSHPEGSSSSTATPVKKASKKLKLQLAVSDYRQGKWTPKRVSKDFVLSSSYDVEITRSQYVFLPVDHSTVDGQFEISYLGNSVDRDGNSRAYLSGSFKISGCHGVPENGDLLVWFTHAVRPDSVSAGTMPMFLKWAELRNRSDAPDDDLTLASPFVATSTQLLTRVLDRTPGIFDITPPWQLSYLDQLWLGMPALTLYQFTGRREFTPDGTWLPFFYNDQRRTFFVLPELSAGCDGRISYVAHDTKGGHLYYPQIKHQFRSLSSYYEGKLTTYIGAFNLAGMNAPQRQQLEQTLYEQFRHDEKPPPYPDDELQAYLVRYLMRIVHYHLGTIALRMLNFRRYAFRNFYHPFVCDFAKLVENPLEGIPGLMKREVQLEDSGFSFLRSYGPTAWVVDPNTQDFYPKEIVDFAPDGAYASYNWELFFHAPLFIANSLSKNQRFDEARHWYHYIFNPLGVESSATGGSAISKYWITKPFFETTDQQYIQQRIENILRLLAGDTTVPGFSTQVQQELVGQVIDWRNNPFEPHRIANYRTVAYQKTVVMKYLDNLIAWGDYLFGQDSMESLNEATQLYILAAELLGPRPKKMPPQAKPPLESFNELEQRFDAFSEALVEVENLVPAQAGTGPSGSQAPLPTLYFCIPPNAQMLAYWDKVADRLYKIRNCMNIEGVVRKLDIFEPPIDPGALVKAVAGGVDLGSALAELNAPLPLYRFGVLLQKSNEVCNDVKALGSALLSALEKNDAEALNLIRQSQEIKVLEAMTDVRQTQLDEANDNLEAAKRSKELAQIKKQYYESREFMNTGETVAVALNTASTAIDAGIAIGYSLAGGLKLIPDFVIGASGFGGSPHAVVDTGGKSFGDSADDLVKTLESIAKALDKGAALSSTIASYQRRQDDWNFQRDMAAKELDQLDRQIAAADLRKRIAQKELDNHVSQIENAKAVDAFMHSKYTNQELYQWQLGQISGVYFQSYKLAYSLAKRAERCFRFELGLQDSSFINFGYWDSLKKGLLSGDQLQYDLRRLEVGYLERNRREFELTKHMSLALTDPLALVRLRETGRCFFQLPEEIFDLDYPGHYFRRLKSVSLTLPCVTGPYTTISCTLRLLKNSVRINTGNGDNGYPRNTDDNGLPTDDLRFVESNIPVKAIATSSAQNDSGVFELGFRDERYLPFEGAGVVSEWVLELFTDIPSNNPDPLNPDFGRPLRQFDYGSISDAVLHLKYTAREDAGSLKNGAVSHLRDYFSLTDTTPSTLLLSLRRDFPGQWSRFLNPTVPANGNVFEFEVQPDLFPMRDKGKTLKINTISFSARCAYGGNYKVTFTPPLPAPPPLGSNTITLVKNNQYGGLHFGLKDVKADAVQVDPTTKPLQKWQFKMTRPGGGNLKKDAVTGVIEVEDAILTLGYQWV